MPSLHRGATKEQQILTDQAREEGKAEGIEIGMEQRAQMDIDYLVSIGFTEAANALRNTRIAERDRANVVRD